jgi:hypothetical protein
MTQKSYDDAFAAKNVAITSVLRNVKNIVVAGGAAAHPLTAGLETPGDVDIFVYGLPPNDRAVLWRKVEEVVAALADVLAASGEPWGAIGLGGARWVAKSITQLASPGLITLTASGAEVFLSRGRMRSGTSARLPYPVQIILRAYPSISAILHAFDVPSCCVAYDGRTTYTTTLGAFALVHRANIVNPAYRSLTYETRLVKYFQRGFALVLPHLDTAAIAAGQKLKMPHLQLEASAVEGNFIRGTLVALQEDGTPLNVHSVSDYSALETCAEPQELRARPYITHYHNALRVVRGRRDFLASRMIAIRDCGTCHCAVTRFDRPFIPYDEVTKGATLLRDLLTAGEFENSIKAAVSSICDGDRINFIPLIHVFGLTLATVEGLVRRMLEARAAGVSYRGVLSALKVTFATLLEKCRERYKAAADTIVEWWITEDPGRQYTASRNPRIEDPATWYGTAFARAATESPTLIARSLRALLAARRGDSGPVYGDSCAICLETVARGASNIVALRCGHMFHFASGDGCDGLGTWLSNNDNSGCPTCRAPAIARMNPMNRSMTPPAPLSLTPEAALEFGLGAVPAAAAAASDAVM